MDITDSTRDALILKGDELFYLKKFDSAYRCYTTASYYVGIEKIADCYFTDKKNIILSYRLYKQILKENTDISASVRAKKRVDEISILMVKNIRKWLSEDMVKPKTDSMSILKQRISQQGSHAKTKFYTKEHIKK